MSWALRTPPDNCRPAYIALGSNLGDSVSILKQAVAELATFSRSKPIVSSFWQTTPVDCPPGSALFVNAACMIETLAGETPESLLAKLKSLEEKFGRQPKKQINESRPLDLDIIAFANETRNSPTLIIPHPRAHQRRFVLQPLCEIAPKLILPGLNQTISQLLELLPEDPHMSRLSDARS